MSRKKQEPIAEQKPKELGVDADGAAALTNAIRTLIDSCPGLDGESIVFGGMPEDGGLAMYPVGDAAIEEEHRSVTGKVRQVCLYTFEIGCRSAGPDESRRAAVKEKLDDLGRWLEKLQKFPAIGGGRRILSFARKTSAALYKTEDSREEFWVVQLTARYENTFEKHWEVST